MSVYNMCMLKTIGDQMMDSDNHYLGFQINCCDLSPGSSELMYPSIVKKEFLSFTEPYSDTTE